MCVPDHNLFYYTSLVNTTKIVEKLYQETAYIIILRYVFVNLDYVF